jgi:hypothetical protein
MQPDSPSVRVACALDRAVWGSSHVVGVQPQSPEFRVIGKVAGAVLCALNQLLFPEYLRVLVPQTSQVRDAVCCALNQLLFPEYLRLLVP